MLQISMAFQDILLNIELILILTIISIVKLIKNDTDVWNDYLKPLHYDVEMEFDVYTNVFNGTCNVIIEINRPTKHIAMKKPKMFDITNISMINLENYLIINTQNLSFINETNVYLDFTQSVSLFPGRYRLTYYYNYNNYTRFDDIYFFNPNYTIFITESTKIIRAKQLFPHWDEPIFKSTFNISIAHHVNYKLLSNMPLRRKVRYVKKLWWTHFDKSPLMSAQDLTIVAINTDTAIDIVQNSFTIEFWCAKKKADQAEFARRIAEAVLHHLRYTTLKRRNRKEMPIIYYIVVKSIPHINVNIGDFLLLREKDIIYQNTSDRISDKLKVANFIAHQTTSFWFDDISLWAKEGLITFLTAHILTEIHGMNNMMELFIVQTQQESLRIDSLLNISSHSLHTANFPTVYSFKSPFNYTKASVIWRMLYHLTSNRAFWASIETYIRLHYNELNELNEQLTEDKFWNVMQTIVNNKVYLENHNIDIKTTLNNLIIEYPQLLVERIYLSNKTVFKCINSEFDNNAKYSTLVTYTTKSNDTKSFSLDRQKPVSKQIDQNDWIIVNLKQSGYYRVNYNIENWNKLSYYLYYENVTGIHVLNRAQIIDDAFYFFMQRQLTYSMFWNITSFLFNDTDYIAWYPMIKAVEYMTCIWPVENATRLKDTLKKMFNKLLLNIAYYENSYENDFTKCLREEAIKWACILDDPKCRETTNIVLKNHFERSKQLNEPVYLKRKESMYCRGIMFGDYGDWLNVHGLTETSTQDTLTKLYSLICSPDPEIMQAYLQITMKNECAVREKTSRKMCANIILLIAARHAKNDTVLNEIFDTLQSIKFSSKKETDDIAILIVIITHEHNEQQFSKITEFVKNNMTMSNRQLVHAVEQRIKKRQIEYATKVIKYEVLSEN